MHWITILLVLLLYMFRAAFLPISGVLSRTSAFVHFMQLWWPFATRSRMALTPGSTRSSQLHKTYQSRCMAKNSWWRAERLPETCRVVIPIKLEFSASVGFIHKEFIMMHGHTILKFKVFFCLQSVQTDSGAHPVPYSKGSDSPVTGT
jgi:hypothetical protein